MSKSKIKMLVDTVCKEICEILNGSRMISLGGVKTKAKVIEVFNNLNLSPKEFPEIPEGCFRSCAVKLNDVVYYIGGEFETAWKMDLTKSNLKWEQIASMAQSRSYVDCVSFDNTIVVSGGRKTMLDGLTACEFYFPLFGTWTNLPSLNQPRSAHVLVSCDGCLYTIGGYEDGDRFSSVECLKPGNKEWSMIESMCISRDSFSAVSLNGFIYAIGGMSGEDDAYTVKSCEKYDVSKDEWSYISDMKFPRCDCSACVLGGKIYVVGGLDEEGNAVMEIECYDPLTDHWDVVGKTDEPLYGHSLVVV